jgi:uncharacterized protein (UPF0333 family)
MTTALVIFGVIVLLAVFAVGFYFGHKNASAPTGSPTPQAANAVAVESVEEAEQAASKAEDAAQKKAEETLHASDNDTRARIAKLRARGRAGE